MAVATFLLPDETATARLGRALAKRLVAGDCLLLSGPLGAGKTTLARSIIAACGGPDNAPSPTFTLCETYPCDDVSIWHFDLYRLAASQEIWELGIEEALEEGVSLVEWPERVSRDIFGADALEAALSTSGANRRAVLTAGRCWTARLNDLIEEWKAASAGASQ